MCIFWRLASCEPPSRSSRESLFHCTVLSIYVRLNLINHVLALFRDKFACNTALRNLVFRWESCKYSVWESEKMLKTVQWRRDSRLDLAGGSWLTSRQKLHTHRACRGVEQSCQLEHYRIKIQTGHSVSSRLELATQSSRQPTLFWKNWLFAFYSHISINTPHSHKICVAIQKEKP